MTDSTDYEYLLEVENVQAVELREDGTVVAMVSHKVPEKDLPEDQLVANNVEDEPTDVIDLGGEVRRLAAEHRQKHRPVRGGASEGVISRRMAGTSGALAVVDDVKSDIWSPEVEVGDLVRVSNNHVYAGVAREPGNYGEKIVQPARLDGGTMNDVVGQLAGYVPMSQGVTVDAAARTVEGDEEAQFVGSPGIANLPTIPEEDYAALLGEQLVKSGRTTGVTSGEVVATSASVRVNMGGDPEYVELFRDQIVTKNMGISGDSGSSMAAPSYGEHGGFAGHLFAGSSSSTIINKAINIEREMGISFSLAEEEIPEPMEHTLRIGHGSKRRTFAYSFDYDGEVDAKGRSVTVVENRVNAWTLGWSHTFKIRGHVTGISVPPDVSVKLNSEPVDPEQVPQLTRGST